MERDEQLRLLQEALEWARKSRRHQGEAAGSSDGAVMPEHVEITERTIGEIEERIAYRYHQLSRGAKN